MLNLSVYEENRLRKTALLTRDKAVSSISNFYGMSLSLILVLFLCVCKIFSCHLFLAATSLDFTLSRYNFLHQIESRFCCTYLFLLYENKFLNKKFISYLMPFYSHNCTIYTQHCNHLLLKDFSNIP